MPQLSAGLLLYRRAATDGAPEVFAGHMGGPFWARKPTHSWSIPKGLIEPGEEPLDTARREFVEEVGVPAPDAGYRPLGEYRYSSGKRLLVFTAEADAPTGQVGAATVELEWPPRSGRIQSFPEIDRLAWMPVDQARELLVAAQGPMLDDLLALVGAAPDA
ncbi:MAG: DNA mismatch repair protein MutT [Cellulomonas sp. 73-145]|uniref:NUDIX domain-containing protein n=1 Tax=Cellulomonas sp. 73-145 TaxID=1895739 RepID=UPI00092CD3F7|nr:NUDIX domain-containing protein [Cellulomonas sp. 73-145]OJV58920.1 MAG: DNA mismatch repair protein MutT [Cellulomonas sp. 73-145]